MQYTTLGKRTGLKVSVLGFGAMRLPMKGVKVDYDLAVPMMQRAFEMGVNYVDSAVGYCGADSETAVGLALKGWRDKVIVCTKTPRYNREDHDEFWRTLEQSLKKLQVECIDLYCLHSLWGKRFDEHVAGKGGSYEWMVKAKEQGLIKHICFSFHDTPEELARIAATGMFDVVTCQYNLLDRANESAFKTIEKQGMGIVVMGPVGGGRLGAPSEALQKLIPGASSVPEVALRFVTANKHIDVALSGMSEMKHIEENCRIAARKNPLTAAERRKVEQVLVRYKKLADLYCTGCKYCMPCPHGVDIPRNFDSLNQYRVYDLKDRARRRYAESDNRAALCAACGQCLTKCPQHIEIISQLKETIRTLDEDYGKLAVRLVPGKVTSCKMNGAGAQVELAARVECYNISDQVARPEIVVASRPRGVAVTVGKPIGELGAFERKSLPLKLAGAVRPNRPVRLGLSIANKLETLASTTKLPAELQFLPALAGGAGSLSKGAKAALNIADPAVRTAAALGRRHAATITAAYDQEALLLRAIVRDDDAYLPDNLLGRWVERGDRLELDLDLSTLVRPQADRAPKPYWKILIGLPEASTGKCPIGFLRPGWFPEESVPVTARRLAGGYRLDIRIPWQLLTCPPPKRGSVLGFNARHISHDAGGKVNISRQWAGDAGWVVLA